jgi:uncharacterized membrane protein (UPF0136 family)
MKIFGTILRIIAIVLMGLTAVFTLMGGAGTTCVALAAEKYSENLALLAPYQWLYVIFVITTLAVGVMGVRAVIMLLRSHPGAYRASIISLLAGTVIGVIHIISSRMIRGSSMPVDAVVYVTVLTLVVFLLWRIPGIWKIVNFEKASQDKNLPRNAAAVMLWITSLSVLTVQYWAGPTHMIAGINYADVWHVQLTMLGWGLMLFGFSLVIYPFIPNINVKHAMGWLFRQPKDTYIG